MSAIQTHLKQSAALLADIPVDEQSVLAEELAEAELRAKWVNENLVMVRNVHAAEITKAHAMTSAHHHLEKLAECMGYRIERITEGEPA